MNRPSPFKIGDRVRYTPSSRGLGHDVMLSLEDKLVPGIIYEVERIEKDVYVVVKGNRHPLGGLYWSEFTSANDVE